MKKLITMLTMIVTVPLFIISFSGCSNYNKVHPPCLQQYNYKVKGQGKYKVHKGKVCIKRKEFERIIKGCIKHNEINKRLNNEIKEYNKKYCQGKDKK